MRGAKTPQVAEIGKQHHVGEPMQRIQVYIATGASLATMSGQLTTADEHARASQFQRRERARQFLDGRTLLRLALADALGRPARACVCPTQGSPRLEHDPSVTMSISHSADWVACAVSVGTPCGVDIQTHQPRSCLDIARTFFSADEHAQLVALDEPERGVMFWRLWTLKEAWCKATGADLFAALGKILPVPEHPAVESASAWSFQPADNVTLSAVLLARRAHLTTHTWSGRGFVPTGPAQPFPCLAGEHACN